MSLVLNVTPVKTGQRGRPSEAAAVVAVLETKPGRWVTTHRYVSAQAAAVRASQIRKGHVKGYDPSVIEATNEGTELRLRLVEQAGVPAFKVVRGNEGQWLVVRFLGKRQRVEVKTTSRDKARATAKALASA